MADSCQESFRSGFACFVGRPNAGKSTLTNAIVGQKLAITSSKPQTTRHAVKGIVNRDDAQLILIDTPGLSRPRSLLQQRLNDLVYETWSQVDVIAVTFPSDQRIGPGDEFLVSAISRLRQRPQLIALATKIDLVTNDRLAQHLLAIEALQEKYSIRWEQIIPCSAFIDERIKLVTDLLIDQLEPGPRWYPDDQLSDEPSHLLAAELIREAALEDLRDELPHSLAVEIDEMRMRPGRDEDHPLLDIFASMVVERDSQKGILIGHRGSKIRQIGIAARRQIQALLGTPVHLDLKVKVLKDWQKDPKYLNRLGF